MKSASFYDRLVQAFYWPVTLNALISLIAVPLSLLTDWVPGILFPIWSSLTITLTALLFLMVTFDMQTQRAVRVLNEGLSRQAKSDGYFSSFLRPIPPDRFLSGLSKVSILACIVFSILTQDAKPLLTLHMFSLSCGTVCLMMSVQKYRPDIHPQVVKDNLSYADYDLPVRPVTTPGFLMIWLLFTSTVVVIAAGTAWFGFGVKLF